MPKRIDDGIAVGRDGVQTGRLFSPKAALIFIRTELRRSIGESTMRLWRSKKTGPVFHRDGDGQLWYHENDLRRFYAQRPDTVDGRSQEELGTKRVRLEELKPVNRKRVLLRPHLRSRDHSDQTAA